MNMACRRAVSWAAIYAVAFHAILLGISPIPNGVSVAGDPFSIICRGDVQPLAPTNQTPNKPDHLPGHACEHCNLCSAAGPLPAPDTLVSVLVPPRVTHILRPASSTPRIGLTSDPKLATGPPQVV